MIRHAHAPVVILARCRCSLLSACSAQDAKPAAPAAPKITYDEHVRPILREHCFSCHNADKQESGLALDTYPKTMAGGSSGEVVLAGDLDSSRLWALVSHAEEPKMPPRQDKLAAAKLDLISKWIEQGAPENAGSKVAIKKNPLAAVAASSDRQAGRSDRDARGPAQAAGALHAAARPDHGPGRQPLGAAGGGRRAEADRALQHRQRRAARRAAVSRRHSLRPALQPQRQRAAGRRRPRRAFGLRRAVRREDRQADRQDRRRAGRRAGGRHQRHAHAGRPGRPNRVVRIYSVQTGELLHEIRKHTDWIYAVEFSPDGVLLATADRSGGLFVWEAETAREYLNLRGHNGGVCDVSWRLDSNVLASAGEDATVKLWEMNDGKPSSPGAPTAAARSACASPTTAGWSAPAATTR